MPVHVTSAPELDILAVVLIVHISAAFADTVISNINMHNTVTVDITPFFFIINTS